jgi:putative transposase
MEGLISNVSWRGTHYYLQAYKYIYANPIKAGLSAKCESYKYSSLNFLLGENKATFSVTYDDTLFSDIDGTLQWINHRPTDEAWRSVELAMHRKFFKLSRVDSCRKENPLEKHLL